MVNGAFFQDRFYCILTEANRSKYVKKILPAVLVPGMYLALPLTITHLCNTDTISWQLVWPYYSYLLFKHTAVQEERSHFTYDTALAKNNTANFQNLFQLEIAKFCQG